MRLMTFGAIFYIKKLRQVSELVDRVRRRTPEDPRKDRFSRREGSCGFLIATLLESFPFQLLNKLLCFLGKLLGHDDMSDD